MLPPQAVHQLHIDAEKGDAEAQYALAGAYYNGNGVPRNIAEGARWLEMAATNGHVRAQCDFGTMFLKKNSGVKQDYGDALKWLRRAAMKGDALAFHNIGSMCATGFRDYSIGFFNRVLFANATTDHVEAYKWFTLAAEKGHAASFKDRARIEKRLSATQIDHANHMIQEFKEAANPWVDGWGKPYE
jgi:TPR repeat protein